MSHQVISLKDRIAALQSKSRPSVGLGAIDAQRKISSSSKNLKDRAQVFQQVDLKPVSPSNSNSTLNNSSIGLSSPSSPTNSSKSNSQFTSSYDEDLITPPSTNPPSSPNLLNIQTRLPSPNSLRVENGSNSSSNLTDLSSANNNTNNNSNNASLTPTPASPAFTATTDVDHEVPELAAQDLQNNQQIIERLRNDKQHTLNDAPTLDVVEATQDLANLSTNFSATPPVPLRNSVYDDDDDDENNLNGESGWASVIVQSSNIN